jgi:hypothetical protein
LPYRVTAFGNPRALRRELAYPPGPATCNPKRLRSSRRGLADHTFGATADVERLLHTSIGMLSPIDDNQGQLLLCLQAVDQSLEAEDATFPMHDLIDGLVDRLNGVARLRWGRTFEGVSVAAIRSFDEEGHETRTSQLSPLSTTWLPRDFADKVEGLGHQRPQIPKGAETVMNLDLGEAMAVALSNPDAARAVHLVD